MRNILVGLVAAAVVATVVIRPATGETVAGSAGTDTRLPATDSQVTESGRGVFANLRITVNQTRNLVNQAISVTWTGGKPTRIGGGAPFGDNYLQIMQCWGDDDGSIPDNPGPPPEQCVQGAYGGIKGGRAGSPFPSGSFAMQRIVSSESWPDVFDPSEGAFERSTGYVWKPFRAVDGTEVGVHMDQTCSPDIQGCSFWLNPYFNIVTTNEIPGARTGPNGEGAELFEVTTGVESSGLGCGQLLEPAGGGSPRVPKCWLVVVPRGDLEVENAGLPVGFGRTGIVMSALSARAWANRVAIPLEFNPVDSPCDFSADPRQIVGSELASLAVASWQPKLCSTPGAPPYAYAGVADERARRQLLAGTPGSPGMAVISRPIDPSLIDPGNPVVYAPLSLSATVIGFNVERNPDIEADRAEQDLAGVRVAEINLTPRLVAKLLTQSYRQQVNIIEPPPYAWVEKNPLHLGSDPDFLQFNPEFALLQHSAKKNFGGLLMPAGNFDHARRLWEYVLADPEARAWLDGQEDPWGMKVNPFYATSAEANAGGVAFGQPVPESFPKSDPYCYQAPPRPTGGIEGQPLLTPAPLCGTDWLPYSQSLRDTARQTRLADDGAKVEENGFAYTADQIFKKSPPQPLGVREMLSITDSASAFQFGVQTARLSRAGDNVPGRAFIAADIAGMTAAVDAMAPREDPAVVEPDPTATAAGAYPLTHLTYAAVTPLALPEQERQEYAAFIEYATGPGQDPGQELGQLPRGYAPLPDHLRVQAASAASVIRFLEVEPAQTESPTSPGAIQVTPATTPFTTSSSSPVSGAEPPHLTIPPRQPDVVQPVPLASEPVAMSRTPTAVAKGNGLMTPIIGLATTRFALPALGVIALLAALAAVEISKRPRDPIRGPTPSADSVEAP
ncbi:MAG: hypothetical protein HYZ59_02735 [Actinobacteria bacterium]|nr:hypothetical protein [Actinomycetota bacterium]